MIEALAVVLLLGVAAVLVYAATRPATCRFQRSTRIAASADRIFPLINDLHRFNTWNPYEKKDPNMKGSYRGPASGPGAGYVFDGDRNVGQGSIEITESSPPSRVTMRLDMRAPIAASNVVEFTLRPQGDATEVTWAMQGPSPYLARLIGVFVNMDALVGKDFEAGLADLKAAAEHG